MPEPVVYQPVAPETVVILAQSLKLPAYTHWQGLMQGKGVDLMLAEFLDLQTHTSGRVAANLEGVRCSFELTRSPATPEQNAALPAGAETCDIAITVRFAANRAADAMAGLLAAGALAELAQGYVLLGGGQCISCDKAFDALSAKVNGIRQATTLEAAFLDRRLGVQVNVTTLRPDVLRCPRCRETLDVRDPEAWDGEKHLRCGQKITPIAGSKAGPKKRLVSGPGMVPTKAPRKWWWPF